MKVTHFATETKAVLRAVPDDFQIRRLATLEDANPTDASMVTSDRWISAALESKAGLLIVTPAIDQVLQEKAPHRAVAVLQNPWAGVKWLLEAQHPDPSHPWPGIHPSAIIHESASIGSEPQIGPNVVIGPECVLGDRVRIGAGTILGGHCRLGNDVSLHAGVILEANTLIGDRVIVQAGAVIGSDGFKYEMIDGKREKIPQVGRVRLEAEVEVGANTTIDRASLSETVVGQRSKIDNLSQLGHNVHVGRDCIIVSQTGIAGSSILEDGVILAGQVGVADHCRIGAGSVVLARGAVKGDLPARQVFMGEPAVPRGTYQRYLVCRDKIPDAMRDLKKLKRQVDELIDRINALEKGVGE